MGSIVGISGAQGQGKSTLINYVTETHDFIHSLDVQTARETLKDWGYSLTEVNSFMPLKVNFQEELFNRHVRSLERELTFGTDSVKLVERTFADIFAYALTSVGPFNQYSDWLNEYANKCSFAQNKYFAHIIYLSGREYTPQEDGVRSINSHFSKLTDYLISYYTNEFDISQSKVTQISDPDIIDRVYKTVEVCKNVHSK
jgi:deoxyadenosine/deoxycytidine kinase